LIFTMPDRDPGLFTRPNPLGPAALPPLSYPDSESFGALKASPVFALATRSRGLLSGYRRYLGLVAFVLIATPLVIGLFGPQEAAKVRAEGRNPAATPSIWSDGLDFSKRVDAYLKDRFGLRKEMIRLALQVDNLLSAHGNENGKVLIGRDGRMYAEQDEAVRQSAGIVMRDRSVKGTAEYLASQRDMLAQHGIGFLVALPPNTATIYPEELPSWARNNGKATEYDLLLTELSKRGVRAIDLRPVLLAAKADGGIYLRHDSHWTPRGALTAFNTIVGADGHSDWRMSAAAVLAPPTIRHSGDLASFIGQRGVTEPVEEMTLPGVPADKWTSRPYTSFTETGDKPTGTVLVVGDSFTASLFPPMLARHVKKVAWAHDTQCDFDWQAMIDRYHPDEVWWMPTERFLNCMPRELPADSTK
jgi:alginate O-acetyltransferase complex protein AlgJ